MADGPLRPSDPRPRQDCHPSAGSYWQLDRPYSHNTTAGAFRPPRHEHYDYVVIGAGFAGLATALHILQTKPRAKLAILESETPGYGASGRSGGLISPLPAPVWLLTADRLPDHAWAVRHLYDSVHSMARWLQSTFPESACTPTTLDIEARAGIPSAALTRIARTLTHTGIEHEQLPANDHRHSGLRIQAHTLHPTKTIQALCQAVEDAGAKLFMNQRVKSVSQTSEAATITLNDEKRLHASAVIVCTNADTGSLKLPDPPRARPVHNYMLATRALSPKSLASLPRADCFCVELSRAYLFSRVHEDRMLLGGIEKLRNDCAEDFAVPNEILADLKSHLTRVTPTITADKLEIGQAWSGRFHATKNDLPIIRRDRSANRIIYNVGYGGTGIAMTLVCAPLAASLATNEPDLSHHRHRLHHIINTTKAPILPLARFAIAATWQALTSRR